MVYNYLVLHRWSASSVPTVVGCVLGGRAEVRHELRLMRSNAMRDDFSKDVKEALSLRVCLHCSLCGRQTSGPTAEPEGRVLVGEAAHICGASPRGPRYDRKQTPQERRSVKNGIWLCSGCAKQVDDDKSRYTVSELRRIKQEAEERARKALLIPGHSVASGNWQELQLSRVSSFEVPVRLPQRAGTDEVDPVALHKFSEHLLHWLALSFRHTCVATPFDDFVYVLSFERAARQSEPGFIPFDLSLFCHITAFVWAFKEWAQFFIKGRTDWKPGSRLRDLPGEQWLDADARLGKLLPYRISRSGPTSILIRGVADRPISMADKLNTSGLLRLLSVILKSKVIVWDDADQSPDLVKVTSMATEISDSDRFSWDQVRIDRDDPESWEFVGNR